MKQQSECLHGNSQVVLVNQELSSQQNISCHLEHIFGGGYSAGYYSYKWAEALDADAFEHFKKNGIFNKEVATSFRTNILEKGNTKPPMELYVKFRGKEPDPNAMFRRDQLLN